MSESWDVTEEADGDVESAFLVFMNAFEEAYGEASTVNKIATLVRRVSAYYAETWEEAFAGIAKVIASYGSEASLEVGEIEEGDYSVVSRTAYEDGDTR